VKDSCDGCRVTRSTPVRPIFRVLAWVLGPLLLGAGLLLVVLDLIGRRPHGWPAWSHNAHLGLWLGVGNFCIGIMILRTARTGNDPYTIRPGETGGGTDEVDR
jgi:hypothetical protein